MVLPHGDVGWSAVCDCSIPDHANSPFAPRILFPYSTLFSVARQAGLSLTWTETPKTGFLAMKAIFSAN